MSRAAPLRGPGGSVLTDRAGFAELASIWDERLRGSCCDSVFLTHEWLSAWLGQWGAAGELRVVTVPAADGGVGCIMPLFLRRREGFLRLATIGQETMDDEGIILPAGEDARELLARALEAVFHRGGWDVLQFNRLPAESGLPAALEAVCGQLGLAGTVEESEESPVLRVSGSWDEYWRTLSKGFRENCRRRQRLLEQDHGGFEFVEPRGEQDVRDALEDLFRLHRQRRQAVGGSPGIFASAAVRDFYRDLAPRLAARGWLRMALLRVGDQTAAVQLNFDHAGRILKKLPAFDARYARYGVGDLLNVAVLQRAFAEGKACVDFLRGGEQYKFKFQPAVRTLYRATLYADTARGRVARAWFERCRPAIRSLGPLRRCVRALRPPG